MFSESRIVQGDLVFSQRFFVHVYDHELDFPISTESGEVIPVLQNGRISEIFRDFIQHTPELPTLFMLLAQQAKIRGLYEESIPDALIQALYVIFLHDIGKGKQSWLFSLLDQYSPYQKRLSQDHVPHALLFLTKDFSKKMTLESLIEVMHYMLPEEQWLCALILCHHICFGSDHGYPNLGIKGKQIHIAGRIMAIVDTFDALLYERKYRVPRRLSPLEAFHILLGEQERHYAFDDDLLTCFVEDVIPLIFPQDFLDILLAYRKYQEKIRI